MVGRAGFEPATNWLKVFNFILYNQQLNIVSHQIIPVFALDKSKIYVFFWCAKCVNFANTRCNKSALNYD